MRLDNQKAYPYPVIRASHDDFYGESFLAKPQFIIEETRVKLTIPGHSYLQVGDVVRFNLPSLEPNKGEFTGRGSDEFHSGRYLVIKLRHRVILGQYKMVLTCIKDSVYNKLSGMPNEYYSGKQPPQGDDKDIYKLDEFHLGQRMGHHR